MLPGYIFGAVTLLEKQMCHLPPGMIEGFSCNLETMMNLEPLESVTSSGHSTTSNTHCTYWGEDNPGKREA